MMCIPPRMGTGLLVGCLADCISGSGFLDDSGESGDFLPSTTPGFDLIRSPGYVCVCTYVCVCVGRGGGGEGIVHVSVHVGI